MCQFDGNRETEYMHCSRSSGATAERPEETSGTNGIVWCGGQSVNKYARVRESCGKRARAFENEILHFITYSAQVQAH